MYDFIGDIHGHADELEALLLKMDYSKKNGIYQHPERKVFFVGDFIDRGPKIKETLELVKHMVDAGHAKAVMGNHEYNAICFATPDKENGDYLRKRYYKNIKQHLATINQLTAKEYDTYIEWFKSLPLFYEAEDFRVVHATWDYDAIAYLDQRLENQRLSNHLLPESADRDTRLFLDIETILKGKEMKLPDGLSFHDKDGNIRHHTRIKWWLEAHETNLRDASMVSIPDLPAISIPSQTLGKAYKKEDKPVFFGHYWLKGEPGLYRNNICCLDFSVAKGGCLVSYRWNGEQQLNHNAFVWV